MLDGGQHNERVEVLDHDGGGAVAEDGHDAQHTAEAVEQRHRQAHAVRVRELLALADVVAVVEDVAVGEHDALGEAGRAGRVLHIDDVAVADALLGLVEDLVVDAGAELEQLHARVHAALLLLPQVDDVAQAREARADQMPADHRPQFGDKLVEDVDVADVAQAVDDAQRVHVDNDLLDGRLHALEVAIVVGVDGDQDGADLGGREHEREPFGDVARPDAHMVAAADADGQQALRHLVGAAVEVQVAPAEPPVRVHDEGMVRLRLDQTREEFADGLLGEELVVVSHDAVTSGCQCGA